MFNREFRNKRIIFHGNSLWNFGNANVPNQRLMPITAYNALIGTVSYPIDFYDFSVGGKQTSQLITDFPTIVAPNVHAGDIVCMWEAVNEVGVHVTAAQGWTNYQIYCGLVHALGAKVVVFNTAAADNAYVADYLTFNSLLAADHSFADAYGDMRITHYTSTADAHNTTYYNADLVHRTTLGYTEPATLVVAPTIATLL